MGFAAALRRAHSARDHAPGRSAARQQRREAAEAAEASAAAKKRVQVELLPDGQRLGTSARSLLAYTTDPRKRKKQRINGPNRASWLRIQPASGSEQSRRLVYRTLKRHFLKAADRSSVPGWVENSFIMARLACRADAFARYVYAASERSDQRIGRADVFGGGGVGIVLAVREIAIWISMAAIGPRISMARASKPLPPSSIVTPSAAKQERHAGERGDGRRNGGRDGADQNVAVQHMAQLMRDHAFEFAVVSSAAGSAVNASRSGSDCARWRRRWAMAPA